MAPLFRAYIEYEDPYVQPLLLDAIQSELPEGSYERVGSIEDVMGRATSLPLLQWAQYESLNFDLALSSPSASQHLINAYIIRKSLIRKHYLSNTIHHWVTKNPASPLKRHFKPSVAFELDYAEFLDDALVEADAWELTESMRLNEGKEKKERQYWILKPGMSDRGQGIRLFSTLDELQAIFGDWEAEAGESDDDDDDGAGEEAPTNSLNGATNGDATVNNEEADGFGVRTSHLRHFLAQPYIHPPLLIPGAPYSNRKFHIRTYVVAAGALRVYVYDGMLALFASEPYVGPWEDGAGSGEGDEDEDGDEVVTKMRNIHLTNTCIQNASTSASTSTTKDDPHQQVPHVFPLHRLPLPPSTHQQIREQINTTTTELFRAAITQSTNFQPLPQSFEILGFDFLVEDTAGTEEGLSVTVHLLEVNAFPDFAQTGAELADSVVRGLFKEVVMEVVGPYFGVETKPGDEEENGARKEHRLEKVLDLDLHLR